MTPGRSASIDVRLAELASRTPLAGIPPPAERLALLAENLSLCTPAHSSTGQHAVDRPACGRYETGHYDTAFLRADLDEADGSLTREETLLRHYVCRARVVVAHCTAGLRAA